MISLRECYNSQKASFLMVWFIFIIFHVIFSHQHGLFEDPYDPTVDASVFNAFSTAVLRFGHSGLHQMVGQLGSK